MPGRISEAIIEDVRDRSDIVAVVNDYVPLKARGNDHWACCPYHKEKTPSFKVSASHQTFYCFGCKKSGNVFQFVMDQENVDFVGAVRLLARRGGVIIHEEPVMPSAETAARKPAQKEQIFNVLSSAAKWYAGLLRESQGAPAMDYLQARGLDSDAITKFGLGYSPDAWDATLNWGQRKGYGTDLLLHAGLVIRKEGEQQDRIYDRFRGRLMFPIWDEMGRVVGFSARTLDKDAKTAKYINTPETPVFHKGKVLYGLHLARQSFKQLGCALICEGQLDVIACHRAGLTNAVAPQGTAFTETQARVLKRYADQITFAFDADEAGEKAAQRSLEVAFLADLRPQVVMLPADQDPDGLFQKAGAEGLKKILTTTTEAFEFLFALVSRNQDIGTPEGKEAVARQLLDMIVKLPTPVVRAARCQWLSQKLDLPESAIFQMMNGIISMSRRRQRGRGGAAGSAPASNGSVAFMAVSSQAVANRTLQALLDLALRNKDLAHRMAENEALAPDELGESPLGQALALVLQKTAEDKWDTAPAAIGARTELIGNPEVAEIIHQTRYPQLSDDLDPREQARIQQLLKRAMVDCLRKMEQGHLTKKRATLIRQWQDETDPDKARAIGQQITQLDRQRTIDPI